MKPHFIGSRVSNLKLTAVCASVLMATTIPTFSAFAQDTADDVELETVVVTGSRIQRPEFSQPAPVTSIGQDEIQRFATPDLGSILGELPSISATGTLSGNATTLNGADAGVSSPDLRSLGLARTLTLVNGKRQVGATAGSAQVDLSTIPTALVERVDIVTGGASAVYGSDAVSGVVNVILRDDFEGFEVNVSAADSLESVNNQNVTVSGIYGLNFAEDKGNFTLFASREETETTVQSDIRQFQNFGTIVNPDNTGEEDGIPDRLVVPNILSERISRQGVLNPFGGGIGLVSFLDDGTPVDQTLREGTANFAFGSFPNGCITCFDLESSRTYIPEVERSTVGAIVGYEINDNVSLYGNLRYVDSDIVQLAQPIFRFGNVNINVQDNAFIDAGLRQRLLDGGQQFVQFSKFLDELGPRSATNTRELLQYSAGVKGDFEIASNEVSFDVSYTVGEVDNVRVTPNELIADNFAAALDSVIDPTTGQAVCRSLTAGSLNPQNCVAFNPFGFAQSSLESRDFVSEDVIREDRITQDVFTAVLTGDTSEFLNLQGGPVSYVSGFEYRKETSATVTDAITQSGISTNAATPDSSGEFDVTEFFTEISLPLLKDKPLAHELTFSAAYRTADYSHVDDVDAWKVDFLWAPVESLRFRGTLGEAVRAPNIDEAFRAFSPGFANIADPCDNDNINNDPDRVANCAALGIPAGFEANDNVSIDTLSGGNPNLDPESAESYTLGFIFQPTFIPGLSLTLDYYDIEITDAISFVASQNVINNCVDSSDGLDEGFCSQIDRNPVTNDIDLVRSGFLNASAFDTEGYEFNVRYSGLELGRIGLPGELNLSLQGNFVEELNFFVFQDRPDEIDIDVGEVGDPELQYRVSANYQLDNLNLVWTARYIDRSFFLDISPTGDIEEDQSPAFEASITTHDLSANYRISDSISVYGGVRNVFDDVPSGDNQNALYDLVGRRAFFGVRANF